MAWRFSPVSNDKRDRIKPEDELRVLIATDVLSEGQNLQDAAIVVNYDLPWAIIRLIQRAGRVDRIGQKAENILCYSFLPADGVDGSSDCAHGCASACGRMPRSSAPMRLLRRRPERPGSLRPLQRKGRHARRRRGNEVDLASYAYQIWKNAITRDPHFRKSFPTLLRGVFHTAPYAHGKSTRRRARLSANSRGQRRLGLGRQDGNSVTESQLDILKAADCIPDTPALPRQDNHHDLVRKGVESLSRKKRRWAVNWARPSGARFRTYERLKRYAEEVKGTLFDSQELLQSHRRDLSLSRCARPPSTR